MELTVLDCFVTEEKNSGNRAAVITNFIGGKHEKQKLAQKLYFPVTVFISKENSEAPLLEYFAGFTAPNYFELVKNIGM